MVARQAGDLLCDVSVTNMRQRAEPSRIRIVHELGGAALIAVTVLLVPSLSQSGSMLGATVIGLAVLLAVLATRHSDTHANPMVALMSHDETLSADDAVRAVTAQLVGGILAGLFVAAIGVHVSRSLPSFWGELALSACVVASAIRVQSRIAPSVISATATIVLGATCVGNAAVAIALAVACACQGTLVGIGPLLAAQLIGALLALVLVPTATET